MLAANNARADSEERLATLVDRAVKQAERAIEAAVAAGQFHTEITVRQAVAHELSLRLFASGYRHVGNNNRNPRYVDFTIRWDSEPEAA